MAGGYRAQPRDGAEDLVRKLNELTRRVAQLEGSASIRNSGITGGGGIVVGEDGGPQVTIVQDANPLIGGTVYFSASDPNIAGGINGSINQLAIFAPFTKGTPAVGTAEIDLVSGPSVASTISLTAGGAGIRLYAAGSIQPLAQATVQDFDFFSGASGPLLRTASGALVFPTATAECRVRTWDDSAYEPIRASAFTVSSSRQVKQDVTDLGWSPLDVVHRAKARSWRYRADHADPDRVHIGPMAEDLPAELVDNTSETPALDLGVLVGVLWAALQEMAEKVARLEAATT